MIIVDVYFPSLNTTYDFRVDEEATVAEVIREISEMMAKRERSSHSKEEGAFFLCSRETEQVLPGDIPLGKCGVGNGSCLFMV